MAENTKGRSLMKIRVEYFAHLKELAGKSGENLEMPDSGLKGLYESLKDRYRFPMPISDIRAAVNDEFVPWDHPVKENDTVVFIPPVTGG
ncbi:MoaD/ThiS family protein [Acetobacteraceae bacterium]|nr:MoaD/ThiS family protein [Acetobacteraceae bacterium]